MPLAELTALARDYAISTATDAEVEEEVTKGCPVSFANH